MPIDYASGTTPKPPMHPMQLLAIVGLFVSALSWLCSGWSMLGVDWQPSPLSSFNPPATNSGANLTPAESVAFVDALEQIAPLDDASRDRLIRAIPKLELPLDPEGPPAAMQVPAVYFRTYTIIDETHWFSGRGSLGVGISIEGQKWVSSGTLMMLTEVADDGTQKIGQRIPPRPDTRLLGFRLNAVGVVASHVLSYALAVASALTLWRLVLGTRLLIGWAILKPIAVICHSASEAMRYSGMMDDMWRTTTIRTDGTTVTASEVLGGYGGSSIVPLVFVAAGLIMPMAILLTAWYTRR
ncbi:MAG: hypothetical protein AAGI46_09825 [Planctomycetota bacterium]